MRRILHKHLIHSTDCFFYFLKPYILILTFQILVDLRVFENLFFKEQYLLQMKSLYPSLLDYKSKYSDVLIGTNLILIAILH